MRVLVQFVQSGLVILLTLKSQLTVTDTGRRRTGSKMARTKPLVHYRSQRRVHTTRKRGVYDRQRSSLDACERATRLEQVWSKMARTKPLGPLPVPATRSLQGVRGQSGTGASPSWREPSHLVRYRSQRRLVDRRQGGACHRLIRNSVRFYLRDYLLSHWVFVLPGGFPYTLVPMDVPFYRFSYRFSLGDLYICEHSYSSSGANCCVLRLVSLPSGLARWHAGRDHQISAFCS
ncbi:hypothetical protein V1504DRAFT_319037 [Lipomyces starkeyi]